jgi:hypothetical protein
MDVEEFVKTTLVQIVEGVHDAMHSVGDHPAAKQAAEISPSSAHNNVEFDIAVTVTESSGLEAKGGLKVASLLSVGGGGSSSTQTAAVSRIKFQVPLVLPHRKREASPSQSAGRGSWMAN